MCKSSFEKPLQGRKQKGQYAKTRNNEEATYYSGHTGLHRSHPKVAWHCMQLPAKIKLNTHSRPFLSHLEDLKYMWQSHLYFVFAPLQGRTESRQSKVTSHSVLCHSMRKLAKYNSMWDRSPTLPLACSFHCCIIIMVFPGLQTMRTQL